MGPKKTLERLGGGSHGASNRVTIDEQGKRVVIWIGPVVGKNLGPNFWVPKDILKAIGDNCIHRQPPHNGPHPTAVL
jgi:hypothetical protein